MGELGAYLRMVALFLQQLLEKLVSFDQSCTVLPILHKSKKSSPPVIELEKI